jgi:hypothetical protein
MVLSVEPALPCLFTCVFMHSDGWQGQLRQAAGAGMAADREHSIILCRAEAKAQGPRGQSMAWRPAVRANQRVVLRPLMIVRCTVMPLPLSRTECAECCNVKLTLGRTACGPLAPSRDGRAWPVLMNGLAYRGAAARRQVALSERRSGGRAGAAQSSPPRLQALSPGPPGHSGADRFSRTLAALVGT